MQERDGVFDSLADAGCAFQDSTDLRLVQKSRIVEICYPFYGDGL